MLSSVSLQLQLTNASGPAEDRKFPGAPKALGLGPRQIWLYIIAPLLRNGASSSLFLNQKREDKKVYFPALCEN